MNRKSVAPSSSARRRLGQFVPIGQHDHRDVAQRGLGAHPLQHLEGPRLGQRHLQQHQVGPLVAQHLRGDEVTRQPRDSGVSGAVQELGQHSDVQRFVVDDDDPGFGVRWLRPALAMHGQTPAKSRAGWPLKCSVFMASRWADKGEVCGSLEVLLAARCRCYRRTTRKMEGLRKVMRRAVARLLRRCAVCPDAGGSHCRRRSSKVAAEPIGRA